MSEPEEMCCVRNPNDKGESWWFLPDSIPPLARFYYKISRFFEILAAGVIIKHEKNKEEK